MDEIGKALQKITNEAIFDPGWGKPDWLNLIDKKKEDPKHPQSRCECCGAANWSLKAHSYQCDYCGSDHIKPVHKPKTFIDPKGKEWYMQAMMGVVIRNPCR